MEQKPIEYTLVTGEVLNEEEFLKLAAFAYSRDGRRTFGQEIPNPIPLEPPLGFVPSLPIHEIIRQQILRSMSDAAEREGFEGPDDAEDFDVGDDYDPVSPHEEMWDPQGPFWPQRFLDPNYKDPLDPTLPSDPNAGGSGAEPPPTKPAEPEKKPA